MKNPEKYQDAQVKIQEAFFESDKLGGEFKKKPRPFVLKKYEDNFFEQVNSNDVINYFRENGISWWNGEVPTRHTLSSQIACLNHLFAIRNDEDAVLSIARMIDPEFDGVMLLDNDKEEWKGYISFEVVSETDHLNERRGRNKKLTRGSQCTSIDAVILATKKGNNVLLAIEWKYVEHYSNFDKSKGKSGSTRLNRYSGSDNVIDPNLIQKSNQLKDVIDYPGSVYFFEPFYQLMRQTLWCEQMIKYKKEEKIKADDFIHVHVVPTNNQELRGYYECSKSDMHSTWVNQLKNPAKYVLISPDTLLANLPSKYNKLKENLAKRYWQ